MSECESLVVLRDQKEPGGVSDTPRGENWDGEYAYGGHPDYPAGDPPPRCAHTDYECDCGCPCGKGLTDKECGWPDCGCACGADCRGCALAAEAAWGEEYLHGG